MRHRIVWQNQTATLLNSPFRMFMFSINESSLYLNTSNCLWGHLHLKVDNPFPIGECYAKIQFELFFWIAWIVWNYILLIIHSWKFSNMFTDKQCHKGFSKTVCQRMWQTNRKPLQCGSQCASTINSNIFNFEFQYLNKI